jgi:outer membrane protein assembly factor BamB
VLNGGRLISVDVASEYLDHRWELMFPNSTVSSAPALFGDVVYCGAGSGIVTAVAYDTREPVWPIEGGIFRTYGEVVADLVVDETGLYVASTDGKLCALNRNNGKVKWQFISAHDLRDAPVVTKDLVFQRVPTMGMVAIDKLAGKYNRVPKWNASDVVKILCEDDKNVYALREDNMIAALDKTTGKTLFVSHRHDLVTYTTNTKDATIFAVTTLNRVLAINPVLKPGVVGEMAWEPVNSDPQVLAAAR